MLRREAPEGETMKISLPHYRFLGIMLGVTFVFVYLLMGGPLSNPSVVQLDFSMYPEDFEGLEVEIDGKVVGKLQKYGQRSVSGFEVDEGIHLVRVVSTELDCPPMKVKVGESEKVRLMLDYGSSRNGRTIITMLR
jgi:hypothetical protein